ncbi:MAG: hypothetical protein O3C43_00990 [Verrucomicrobia bacterium]|nr:hypothetical protein [Verrucomicrobiota bacterium]
MDLGNGLNDDLLAHGVALSPWVDDPEMVELEIVECRGHCLAASGGVTVFKFRGKVLAVVLPEETHFEVIRNLSRSWT